MGSCCGGNGAAVQAAKAVFQNAPQEQGQAFMSNGLVRMEFIGQERGAVTHHVNGRPYRGADSSMHKYVDADPADVQKLVALGKWRVVRTQANTPTAPMAVPPSSPQVFNWPPPNETVLETQQSGMDWGVVTQAEQTKPAPATLERTPDPAGQIAIAPAFEDDYQVVNMTISDVKTAIASGTDPMTLLGWLHAEQTSEKPRSGVIGAIEKALER